MKSFLSSILGTQWRLPLPIIATNRHLKEKSIPHFHQLIPHTYKIDTTRSGILRNPIFPLTRTLYLTTPKIDPPSPRFLAIYRAITLVLHQSATGNYIDRILEHLDQINIRKMDLPKSGTSRRIEAQQLDEKH